MNADQTTGLKVLALQPYFGGSHAQFHNGWVANSSHDWTTLTLPPRHWKWRMRHSSIYFAEQVQKLAAQGESWDIVVCTDMLNVAEWKGLVGPQLASIPLVIYFHENQFAYPNRTGTERDLHFPFTNFTSAIAADKLWFNSRFNFDSMMAGIVSQTKRWPDFVPTEAIKSLAAKVEIQPPGIEPPPVDIELYFDQRNRRSESGEPIHIVWAGRWEHDKNPDDLHAALRGLELADVPFQISVVGQTFRILPPVFSEIKAAYSNRIRRWGFQESRQQYWEALAEADVFVSTANHEFFGLSAAESIATGVQPLLPDRLAYPELLGHAMDTERVADQLYDGSVDGLVAGLQRIDGQRKSGAQRFGLEAARRLANSICWPHRASQLDQSLAEVAKSIDAGLVNGEIGIMNHDSPADTPAPTIHLDQFLKTCGVATGGQAKRMIQGGEILVNGKIETRRRKQLSVGDEVALGDTVFVVAFNEE